MAIVNVSVTSEIVHPNPASADSKDAQAYTAPSDLHDDACGGYRPTPCDRCHRCLLTNVERTF